jgi:peptide/nickel transport system substrate-binding protein
LDALRAEFVRSCRRSAPEPAAVDDPGADRLRLYADLSLPRPAARHPVGTGPFRFVEFKPNESIKLARNPDYWKPGRLWLDGIEYTIIPNRSTAILAFISGEFDLTFPYEVTVPLLKDTKSQAPEAVCELMPSNASANLLVNGEAPRFDNPDLRRALALALDRQSFIDILAERQGDIGGAMLPPPAGVWGMPPDILAPIPAMAPISPRTAPRRAKSCRGWATGPTSGSRSRSPRATSRAIATRRSS